MTNVFLMMAIKYPEFAFNINRYLMPSIIILNHLYYKHREVPSNQIFNPNYHTFPAMFPLHSQ